MKRIIKPVICICILVALCFTVSTIVALVTLYRDNIGRELSGTPTQGVWYRIVPDGTVSSNGTVWHGLFRKGTENNVLIYFQGGGLSVDKKTANMDEEFYYHTASHDSYATVGIAGDSPENPLKDWSMIIIPYGTADFHVGTGNFDYKTQDGSHGVLRHHGYQNFELMMDMVDEYIGTPDAVVIAGWSAGGFGASMLADEILTDHFPNVKNQTILIDAAVLMSPNWKYIASEVWQAPPSITDHVVSENLTLDNLQFLSSSHPEAKILLSCSIRDGALSKYQNYLTSGSFSTSPDIRTDFTNKLSETVTELYSSDNIGIFIWDDHPEDQTTWTSHTVIGNRFFEDYNGMTAAYWVESAINGTVLDHGLDLLPPPPTSSEALPSNNEVPLDSNSSCLDSPSTVS